MSKLIVGLGNPGREYEKTRHNVGFWCVERTMAALGIQDARSKWHGLVAEATVAGEKVYLLRPQTYMNLSGQSVQAAVQFLKLEDLTRDLIVVYDDMDIPLGSLRLREKGSSGGHNGIKSIQSHVATAEFPRVRIGIGRPPFDVTVTDYVLSRFPSSDAVAVSDAVDRSVEAVLAACKDPFIQVMNRFNSRV